MRNTIIATLSFALLPAVAGAETLATVGKKTIDRAAVEKAVRAQLIEVENARYAALKEGLDELIGEALIEQEAAARGVKPEELVQTEITAKVAAPTDAEIQALYDQYKDQLESQPLDAVKPQLVQYLSQRATVQRRTAYLDELKKKYPTRIALRPPTVAVSTGTRPPKGNPKAPVTIVEFSDYECPFCKRAEPAIRQVLDTYGDKVRFAYRDFPLPFHANARPAAEAASCANEQGKFWPYHEKLMTAEDLSEGNLKALAGEVGLDRTKFDECLAADRFADAIEQDIADAQSSGVNGTPAFFINGRLIDGAQPFEKFKEIIDEELERTPQGG